jgi:hypothetical protein
MKKHRAFRAEAGDHGEIARKAIFQARDARIEIRRAMLAAIPAPRGPVVRPTSSAMKPAARMLPMCARATQ